MERGTNSLKLREQQITHHPQDCTGNVHHGFVGVVQIAGFDKVRQDSALGFSVTAGCQFTQNN